MPKLERKLVERYIRLDTDKLYSSIPAAIEYLQFLFAKYPTGHLAENWTGYEDMEMSIRLIEPETDEELFSRQATADFYEKMAREREESERQRKLAKLEALKKELGL